MTRDGCHVVVAVRHHRTNIDSVVGDRLSNDQRTTSLIRAALLAPRCSRYGPPDDVAEHDLRVRHAQRDPTALAWPAAEPNPLRRPRLALVREPLTNRRGDHRGIGCACPAGERPQRRDEDRKAPYEDKS